MQRAKEAGSTPHVSTSPGNVSGFYASGASEEMILLAPDSLARAHSESDDGRARLCNARTLLRAAMDVADEASSARGFWYRTPEYHVERMGHVYHLLAMMLDQMDKANGALDRSESALQPHRTTRRAA